MLPPISPPPRSEPHQPQVLSKLSIQDHHMLPKKLSTFNSEPTRAAASCEIEEETEGQAPSHAANHAAETAAAASSKVVVVLDAEKKPSITALDWAMSEVCKEGDEITVLAYLQHIMSPMGHKMVADLERFIGVNESCLVMTTSEKLDAIEYKIKETGRRQACQKRKIKLEVQIAPGSVAKSVIVREITAINATWVIFEKNTINDRKYFTEYLTSQNVVRMKSDGRSVETICLPNQSLQTSVSMASELSSYSSVDSPTKTLELPTISSAVPPLSSPPSSSVSSSLWGGSRAQWAHATTQTHHPQAHDQAQNPTAFNTFNGQLRSPMDNVMTSSTTAVNINHQEVQASAAGNYCQAFGINSILHQQEQDVFPEITFSPPRECSDQDGKTKYAYQEEQNEHPDVQHSTEEWGIMVWSDQVRAKIHLITVESNTTLACGSFAVEHV